VGKQKCAEPACIRPAEIFISRRDESKKEHLYCSAFCAQQDSDRRDSLTPSDKMEKSSFAGRGAQSVKRLNKEVTEEPEALDESINEDEQQEEFTNETPMELEDETENKELEISSESDFENEAPRELSTELSPISETEEYQHQSLIEDSIRHTHKLAKHVMQKAIESDDVDTQLVNAACNALKQVHALMRLRLDVHKVLRGK
jgi:hypothetical protein